MTNAWLTSKEALNKNKLLSLINNFPHNTNLPLTLTNFLQLNPNLTLEDIYKVKVGCSKKIGGWSALLAASKNKEISIEEKGLYAAYYRAINNRLLNCSSISYLRFIKALCDNRFSISALNTDVNLPKHQQLFALMVTNLFLSKAGFAVHYTKITGNKIKDFNHMQGTAFTNTSLTAESLPRLVELEFQPISAIYRQTNLTINVAFTLFLVTLLFVIQQQNIWPLSNDVADLFNWLMLVLFMFGGFNTLYAAFADKQKFYALRQQDLSYRSGLLFRKTVSQPMLRIQHVELKRGPIDRKVGLAKLQVFSAGGAMHTFEIPGLPLASAESIRQFILDHKDVNRHG